MIGGKSRNRAKPPENLEQVDHENTRTAPNLRTSSTQEDTVQSEVREALSFASSLASFPSTTSLVHENPATARPLSSLVALRCFICASPSVEHLLPLRHQPRWDLGACRHPDTYGSWEAHQECALLIDETIVCETPGCIRGLVEDVRRIDSKRFKLVCISFGHHL